MSPEERFWPKVDKSLPDDCWLWRAGRDTGGYGMFRMGNRHLPRIGAHRASFIFAHGSVPPGAHICHKCDVRLCVNPRHLFAGTPADNTHDMIAKGRMRVGNHRGEHNGRAKLTARQAGEIKNEGGKQKDIAKKYGVSENMISLIKNGKAWK